MDKNKDSHVMRSLYEEICKLLSVTDDEENPSEPYKSKYEAQEKLETIKNLLIGELDGHQVETQEKRDDLESKLGVVFLQLGNIGLHTEELSTGQENFEKALDLIKPRSLSPLCITVTLSCYNNLAILWSHRGEHEKSLTYLMSAKEMYDKYRKQDNVEPPKSENELFLEESSSPTGWDAFQKVHTLTLFYLAQVMEKLGRSHEAAHYCLSTLHRQLSMNDFQTLSWSLNAATLAKFYEDTHKYRLARRLLSAAWAMLEFPTLFGSNTKPPDASEEKISEVKAEVMRRWGNYCVCLLNDSFDSSEAANEDDSNTQEDPEQSENITEQESLEQMEFCQLELSTVEEQIGCSKVNDFDGAKPIFMSGLRWFNDAHKYYTLEEFASTHTEIGQSISSLYKYLAYFDPCPERRSKMHKRRIDVLKPIVDELNPKYYLQVCRQLDYEIAETYSAMVDCKYSVLGDEQANSHQRNKINMVVKNSIEQFDKFLASFRSESGEVPKKYPEECERPVLVAYFHLGRLWSKVLSTSSEEKIQDISKSLENYKFLVDYCDTHPQSASLMSFELPASREIVQLLPFKIQQIRSHMVY